MAHILLRRRCHTVSECVYRVYDVSFSSARCSYPKRAIKQRCVRRAAVQMEADGRSLRHHIFFFIIINTTTLFFILMRTFICYKTDRDPRYIIQYRESEIALIGLTVSEWFIPPSDPAHTSHQPISTRAAVIDAIKPRPMIHCSSSSITPGLDLVNDYMTG